MRIKRKFTASQEAKTLPDIFIFNVQVCRIRVEQHTKTWFILSALINLVFSKKSSKVSELPGTKRQTDSKQQAGAQSGAFRN